MIIEQDTDTGFLISILAYKKPYCQALVPIPYFRKSLKSCPNQDHAQKSKRDKGNISHYLYSQNLLIFVPASSSVVNLFIGGMFNISTIQINGHNNKLNCWPYYGVSKLPKNLSIVLVCLLITPEIPGFVFNLIFVLVCDFKLWLDMEL